MKYYIKTIKELLNSASNEEITTLTQDRFMEVVKTNHPTNTNIEECCINYGKVMKELKLLDCTDNEFGFRVQVNGQHKNYIRVPAGFTITYAGQEFLDKLNNDTIWNKIYGNGKEIGLTVLKSLAPSMLQQYIESL